MPIHPTAIIDRQAEIHPEADIGPYVVIEGQVRVARGVRIMAGSHLSGWTTLDEDVQIHPHVVLGAPPQDTSYNGAESYVRVGRGTVIREFCTIHRGTEAGSATQIGEYCFLMHQVHLAHNCVLGDRVIMAGMAQFAGRVTVGERAFIGGAAMVHQFCRIGTLAMLGGASKVRKDIPPFMTTNYDGQVVGLNVVGMRRAEVPAEERMRLKEAFRVLFRSGLPLHSAIEQLEADERSREGRVAELLEFVRTRSRRGITGGAKSDDQDEVE